MVELPKELPSDTPDVAVNLARAYAALGANLRGDGSRAPDLSDAVRLAELLDRVREAAGLTPTGSLAG